MRAQLLLLALFALAALLQLLYRRLVSEPSREAAGGERAPDRARGPRPAPTPAARPEPSPPPSPRPRVPAPATAHPIARSRGPSRQELRRAVVLMAVLGPCRGLEPAPLPVRSPVGDVPSASRP
jgi:hypothetical protein